MREQGAVRADEAPDRVEMLASNKFSQETHSTVLNRIHHGAVVHSKKSARGVEHVQTIGFTARGKLLVLASAMVLLAVGCGGDDSSNTASTGAPLVALDGSINIHGTKDLGSSTKLDVELDDLYFAPTFIKANPGSVVEISLKNDGKVKHTFTIDETKTNVELEAGQKSSVKVTLPAAGALAFYCSIHRGSGMQGAFSLTATAAATPGVPTTVASSSGGYGY